MKFRLSLYLLLFSISSFCQTGNTPENIKSIVATYFHYDRESIHVQFNKTIYVTNENIAFKGYVINKNKLLPDANTTNVQLSIYNDQKQLVQKQLLFTSLGTFEGGIHLNEKFSSGKYYFHFYTNWMNNFIEDDTFIQTVEIINRNEPYQMQPKEPKWESAKIELFPESGQIIESIINRIGVRISDCKLKGIQITEGKVLDSKGNEISKFKTNEMGNGAFYLNPNPKEQYTIEIKTEKINRTQPLPATQNTGLILSYNNNLANNVLAVAVKTNAAGTALYQNKKLHLLIHQNGNVLLQEFSFHPDETEKTVRFDKSSLNNGVNTIRIIDQDNNEIANRLVYIEKNPKEEITVETKTIANDSLILSVKTNVKKANLSLSLLPENNACITNKSSIIGSLYLNAFLQQAEEETYFYFDNANKNRKQDLELLLLNQRQNKYLWNNIKSNPPKITHPFTQGITIKGSIDKKTNPNSKYKISLIAKKNKTFEEVAVDSNNQFTFENIFVEDSTAVLLQLMNDKSVIKNNKITARVVFENSNSVFQPRIKLLDCPVTKANHTNEFIVFKKPNVTNLKEVQITTAKKTKLVHKDQNVGAKAYKIGENEFGTLLDYIDKYSDYITGFDDQNSVFIKQDRRTTSFLTLTTGSPTVYIDGFEVFDFNYLLNINMNEVDEMYIDYIGFSGFNPGGFGTIKIYLKAGVRNDLFKTKNTSFVVTNGFTKSIPFSNAAFETAKEFNYFGTLSWIPIIEIEANKAIEIKSLKANQKEIQILLEGFSEDGKLISEIKRIPVLNP